MNIYLLMHCFYHNFCLNIIKFIFVVILCLKFCMFVQCINWNLQFFYQAYTTVKHLWDLGYSCDDIITNIFRVLKTLDMDEMTKLDFIKLVSVTHLTIVQGIQSLLQLSSLVANMCNLANSNKLSWRKLILI